jgi:hypothetical protein
MSSGTRRSNLEKKPEDNKKMPFLKYSEILAFV